MKAVKMITILDPGIENSNRDPSSNLGDLIIQESVQREICGLFEGMKILNLSTHSCIEPEGFKAIRDSLFVFVGGTNLLSSNMRQYRQWKISFVDAFRVRKAILFGVGWWQYQERPDLYTEILLRSALSNQLLHSVRDSYTQENLKHAGIQNVINTGCPTMWPLANIKPEDFPQNQAESALLMLTDYNKKSELDKQLIELLLSKYETVYFWPQGRGDLQYIVDLDLPVKMLEHSLKSLQDFLKSNINFDYIGTRLHGGIYCLRAGRRALILEIDNRAKEIARDTHLPTVKRDDFRYINQWIEYGRIPRIKVNTDSINHWRKQFLSISSMSM
jgi:polysaccharide pyruvyl transferase WcaK-like protein